MTAEEVRVGSKKFANAALLLDKIERMQKAIPTLRECVGKQHHETLTNSLAKAIAELRLGTVFPLPEYFGIALADGLAKILVEWKRELEEM